jgi:hypothetical protein
MGPAVRVAGSIAHTVALLADGSVRAWGLNDFGQCAIPAGSGPASDIAAGAAFTAVVLVGAAAPCPADLNADRTVNGFDLGLLLGAWGTDGAPVGADINGDGTVNGFDLGLLLGAWGACP